MYGMSKFGLAVPILLKLIFPCRNPLVPTGSFGLLVPEGRPVLFKVFYKISTYLVPSRSLSYPWQLPDLDVAGTGPVRHSSNDLKSPRVLRRGCGIGTLTPAPRSR